MRLSQYTAPLCEPMHLTDAKLHLRIVTTAEDAEDYTAEDSLISANISAVREVAETETWKAIVLQTWDFYLDSWPNMSAISLPLPPLRAVEFVRYTDSAGATSEFTDFTVDKSSTPGRIVLDYGYSWPSVELSPNNPIHIRFRCGSVVPFTVTDEQFQITAIDHPFSDGDRVRLSVSGGVLPGGAVALKDYFIRDVSGNYLNISETVDGAPVALTDSGSGLMFLGVVSPTTMAGMKLVLADLYEERADTVIGKNMSAIPATLPRAAKHLFAMDSARTF